MKQSSLLTKSSSCISNAVKDTGTVACTKNDEQIEVSEPVPTKSEVVSAQRDMHKGKGKFTERVFNIQPAISAAIDTWDNLEDNEKRSLFENVTYIKNVIGSKPSHASQNQATIVSDKPFMQSQGFSGYCGLCALNNALQYSNLSITQMDDIADDLWLKQVESIGLSLCDDIQQTRSVSGYYSIQVLQHAARMFGYEVHHLDHRLVAKLVALFSDSCLVEQLTKPFPTGATRSFLLAHKSTSGHYTSLIVLSNSIWHLNSLRKKPQVVTLKWVDSLLRKKLSELTLFRVIPASSNITLETSALSSQRPVAAIVVQPSESSTPSLVYISPVKTGSSSSQGECACQCMILSMIRV